MLSRIARRRLWLLWCKPRWLSQSCRIIQDTFFAGHFDTGDVLARFCNPDAPHTKLIARPRGCPPLRRCHRPQVGPSGVGCFVVDVTDFQLRPLASHVKPREPVCSVHLSVYADLAVTFWRMDAACNSADVRTTPVHPPSEYPGRRIILQQLAQSVGRERLSLRALPAFVAGHSVRLAKEGAAQCPLLTQSGHHLLWASRKPNSTITNPVNCRAVGVSPSASHPISSTNGGTSEGNTAARPAPNRWMERANR